MDTVNLRDDLMLVAAYDFANEVDSMINRDVMLVDCLGKEPAKILIEFCEQLNYYFTDIRNIILQDERTLTAYNDFNNRTINIEQAKHLLAMVSVYNARKIFFKNYEVGISHKMHLKVMHFKDNHCLLTNTAGQLFYINFRDNLFTEKQTIKDKLLSYADKWFKIEATVSVPSGIISVDSIFKSLIVTLECYTVRIGNAI